MSMGHTVAVKAVKGVKAALSMTIPLGTGIHRRVVYVEVEDGYDFSKVEHDIKTDPYFASDETHVIKVPCVDDLICFRADTKCENSFTENYTPIGAKEKKGRTYFKIQGTSFQLSQTYFFAG